MAILKFINSIIQTLYTQYNYVGACVNPQDGSSGGDRDPNEPTSGPEDPTGGSSGSTPDDPSGPDGPTDDIPNEMGASTSSGDGGNTPNCKSIYKRFKLDLEKDSNVNSIFSYTSDIKFRGIKESDRPFVGIENNGQGMLTGTWYDTENNIEVIWNDTEQTNVYPITATLLFTVRDLESDRIVSDPEELGKGDYYKDIEVKIIMDKPDDPQT